MQRDLPAAVDAGKGGVCNYEDVPERFAIAAAVFLCPLIPQQRADLRADNHLPLGSRFWDPHV